MTWAGRLRLWGGLLAVLVLVAACTLVFNQRQQRAVSTSATILAQAYPVGTDYGGIVVRQLIEEGDEVRAGAALFEVRSLQLQRDLATGIVEAEDIAADGTTTIRSTVDGTVASVEVVQGGYAQAGAVLAQIHREGSLFVEAEFRLSARDYGRVSRGSSVALLLPDQRELHGEVEQIDVETVGGEAESTVRVVSPQIAEGDESGLIAAGTPVTATPRLRDDGPLAGVSDALADLLRKIGL